LFRRYRQKKLHQIPAADTKKIGDHGINLNVGGFKNLLNSTSKIRSRCYKMIPRRDQLPPAAR
jgi:hypothetical protein